MLQMIILLILVLLVVGMVTTGDVLSFLVVILNAIIMVIMAFINLII